MTARRLVLVFICAMAVVLAARAQFYLPPWAGAGQGDIDQDGYGPGGYGPGRYGPGRFRRGGFGGMERGDGQRLSMQFAGQTRTYILIRPQAEKPLPTVVFMHGKGSNAERMRSTGFGRLGEREGFVTVFPNAVRGIWNFFPPGGPHPFGRRGDDTDFIQELVTSLVAKGISDPNRVYISGISFGGFMALRIACVAPNMFAAVGVISASMPSAAGAQCRPSKPLPLVMINGTADETVPYAGGHTQAGFGIWGTDRTVAFFRQLNGCMEDAQRSEVPHSEWSAMPRINVYSWKHCTGAPVLLYSVVGGGHRPPRSVGPEGFTSAHAMWEFFRDKASRVQ